MKARRKAVPGGRTMRTPTVRMAKPAITPASRSGAPKPRVPGGADAGASGAGGAGAGASGAGGAGAGPARVGSAGMASGGPGSRRGAAIEAVPQPALDALGGRPVDLEVDLGRGLVLPNPVIAAAGPFGYGVEIADLVDLDRLGGIVTRGTSLKLRAGHPGTRLAEVPAGLLVGVGMQNPGIDAVLDRYATTWAKWPVPVIINLCGESAGDLAEIARRLEGAAGRRVAQSDEPGAPSQATSPERVSVVPKAALSLVSRSRMVSAVPPVTTAGMPLESLRYTGMIRATGGPSVPRVTHKTNAWPVTPGRWSNTKSPRL